jgi:hypothetical protein
MDKDRIKNVANEIDSFSWAEYVSLATTIKQDDLKYIWWGQGRALRNVGYRWQLLLTDNSSRKVARQKDGFS